MSWNFQEKNSGLSSRNGNPEDTAGEARHKSRSRHSLVCGFIALSMQTKVLNMLQFQIPVKNYAPFILFCAVNLCNQ